MASEVFQCDTCPKSYNTQGELNRHLKRHSKPLECKECPSRFPFHAELQRHTISQHRVGNDQHSCPADSCGAKFKRKDNLKKHIRKFHASALPPARSDDSMVDATTTASLPQAVALSLAVESVNGIGSVSAFMQAARSGDNRTLELLMNAGFTTETRAGDQCTVLHCAARNGQSKTVQYLLRKGARIDSMNEQRRLPLHEAFLSNDLDTVKVLLEQMSEEQLQSTRWDYERHLAQTKNIRIVRHYARSSAFRFEDFNSNRVFRSAICAKNDELTTALLRLSSIKINEYDGGYTPILDAARYGNVKTMELLLISNRVVKYSSTKVGRRNALHMAALHGHGDIVEQLLDSNFDVKSQDASRRTALHLAAMHGRLETVKLLVLEWKAGVSSQDWRGYTPLHYAAFNGHWKCVHVLLEYTSSKNHPNTVNSRSASTKFVKKDVVTRLLNSAAFKNPNECHGSLGYTLLHYAVQKGDLEVMEVLLAHDEINVNAPDYRRNSPLFMAVETRQIKAVRLLLQHPRIDANTKCWWGATALYHARTMRHREIIDLLLSHGAVDEQAGNAPTIIAEDSSSLTTVKAGHMNNRPLQPEHEFDHEFDSDTFMEGVLDVGDVSYTEGAMMEQEFC